MAAETAGLRDLLRSQRVFPDRMPVFDPYAVPGDPVTLFLRWLEAAIRDAVPPASTRKCLVRKFTRSRRARPCRLMA